MAVTCNAIVPKSTIREMPDGRRWTLVLERTKTYLSNGRPVLLLLWRTPCASCDRLISINQLFPSRKRYPIGNFETNQCSACRSPLKEKASCG